MPGDFVFFRISIDAPSKDIFLPLGFGFATKLFSFLFLVETRVRDLSLGFMGPKFDGEFFWFHPGAGPSQMIVSLS